MKSVIARILRVERKGDLFVTTIQFVDGGEVYTATGVGNDYVESEPIYTYVDDRFNRYKFYRRNAA